MKQSITRNGETYASAGDYILTLARDAGSKSGTSRGALAYLKTHRPAATSPLISLGTERFRSTRRRAGGWDGRTSRLEVRAQVIAEKAATHATPFASLKKLTRKFTRDVYPIAKRALERLLCARVAKAIGGSAWPYRRAESTWAGGSHRTSVSFSDIQNAKGGSCRVWSSNGKWTGSDSYADLAITPRCFELLGTDLIIGGLITLDCVQVAPREYQACWAEQSRGFALKVISGWIIRGYHIAGGTLEQARKKATAARAKAALNAALERSVVDRTQLRDVMVREADSWRGGNCKAGTSSFIRTYAEEIGCRAEIPALELLGLRDDLFTRRAVIAAHARLALKVKTTESQ